MNKTIVSLAAVTIAATALAACSSSGTKSKSTSPAGTSTSASSSASGGSSSVKGSITVLAAASLTGTFATIATQFKKLHPNAQIKFSFGASSDLATQITQGNPVDVFASASTKTMILVTKAGDSGVVKNFAVNTMEIAAAPGNPAKIKTVQNLAKSGVKVALCDTAVPCGVAAQTVFDNAKVTVKPVSRQADVKSTLATVESGEVDAGIVYVTDVKAAGSKVVAVPIPASINAKTTYPITVVKKAPNSATAQAFEDYVLSAAGQQVLQAAGFSKA